MSEQHSSPLLEKTKHRVPTPTPNIEYWPTILCQKLKSGVFEEVDKNPAELDDSTCRENWVKFNQQQDCEELCKP